MAAALAVCRTALVGTGWTISHLVSTNGCRNCSSPPVGAPFLNLSVKVVTINVGDCRHSLSSYHSSRHGSSHEFLTLVHSMCTSRAPALELHNAQVLEMLVQMQCLRSVQVLQEMLYIQEGVTEQLSNIVVSKKCPSCKISKGKIVRMR